MIIANYTYYQDDGTLIASHHSGVVMDDKYISQLGPYTRVDNLSDGSVSWYGPFVESNKPPWVRQHEREIEERNRPAVKRAQRFLKAAHIELISNIQEVLTVSVSGEVKNMSLAQVRSAAEQPPSPVVAGYRALLTVVLASQYAP